MSEVAESGPVLRIAHRRGCVMIAGAFAVLEQSGFDRTKFADRDAVFTAVGKRLLKPGDYFNQYQLTDGAARVLDETDLEFSESELAALKGLPASGEWFKKLTGLRAGLTSLEDFGLGLVQVERRIQGPRGGYHDRARLTVFGQAARRRVDARSAPSAQVAAE